MTLENLPMPTPRPVLLYAPDVGAAARWIAHEGLEPESVIVVTHPHQAEGTRHQNYSRVVVLPGISLALRDRLRRNSVFAPRVYVERIEP